MKRLKTRIDNAISEDDSADSKRADALREVKTWLAESNALTHKMFKMGRIGGLETARRISKTHSELVNAIYDFTVDHILPVANPSKAERISLCAVGGFGRGEMAPHSDLDLLFIQADKKLSAWSESVTEYILYMLWDLNLKVGQSFRTIDQCIKLAKDDQTILTSLLDMRYLAGDEELAEQLKKKFAKDITRGKGRAYIKAKLAERDERHEREGDSRYKIEPNVKEGKGGLRDLHALYWIARFLDKAGDITDPQRSTDYVDLGLFDARAARRFTRAADFLWRTRIYLHYLSDRPTEKLSFDYQTQLAPKMGHASGPIEVSVEKFMREYFTNSREVGALTRIACAKLEEDNRLTLSMGLDRFLPSVRRIKKDGFKLDKGRLNFSDDMALKEQPGLILRLFQLAGAKNLDIHPDAISAISFRRNLIDNGFRKDPENAQVFLETLLQSRAPGATMKVMNEAGVLGRYLIEFGGIVARTQFNMHHAYTVDEHTIGLVRYFHDLESGVLERENPLATEFVSAFTTSQRRILYMTCLLHDTGKGVGDQCIEGARLSRRACARLGLDPDEIETISWLIRRHLDFSETAQRRDISDPETIETFAKLVGTIERLQLLMALTIVDIRAVGPGIWNDWKGTLLRQLYENTAAYLDDKPNLGPESRAQAARENLFERLPAGIAEQAREGMFALPDNYWLSNNLTEQTRHAKFFAARVEDELDAAVRTRLDKKRDITELWILGADRPGLFCDLTEAISSVGASVVGARLFTGRSGQVFDIFYLQNSDGLAFGRNSNHVLETLIRRARAAAIDQAEALTVPDYRPSRRARAIPITPAVRVLRERRDGAEAERILIEVEGRDRPGLLYALAKTFAAHNAAILSAHIEVVGVMAIDTFYIRSESFSAAFDRERLDALVEDLEDMLKTQIDQAA